MSFRFSATTGRLWATDDTAIGDPIVFDTDDGLLFVDPSDVFTGSIAVPARTASSTGVDGTQTVVDVEEDYFVGTPSSPGSRYVRGLIRTTASAAGEMMDGAWRQASGTHIDAMDGVSVTSVPQSDLGGFQRLATLRGFTFFVNELGHLVMRERAVARARDRGSPGTAFNRVCAASTVDFRLLVGSFFGADFTVKPGIEWRRAITNTFFSGGSSSHTISGVGVGYAFSGRRVVAVIHGGGSSAGVPSSVTIGGVAATQIGAVANGQNAVAMWQAVVPTGTSVNVGITWTGAKLVVGVALYVVNNITGAPTVVTATGSGTQTLSVNVAANQVGLAASTHQRTTAGFSTVNWTNAAESYDQGGTNSRYFSSALITPGIGSANVSSAWSEGGPGASISAVWS